jgi:prepilin-type N-terminal cleavage/methylation domain-containing protein
MRQRRGFTLVEVLLAVALLTVVATAAVSWAVSQRRSGAAIEERYERLRQLLACRQAFAEDLRLASIRTEVLRPDEDGRVSFPTLRRLPDEEPRLRTVTWRFDAAGQALVRSTAEDSGDRQRVAVAGVRAARFVRQDTRGLVLEILPLTGEPLSLAVGEAP